MGERREPSVTFGGCIPRHLALQPCTCAAVSTVSLPIDKWSKPEGKPEQMRLGSSSGREQRKRRTDVWEACFSGSLLGESSWGFESDKEEEPGVWRVWSCSEHFATHPTFITLFDSANDASLNLPPLSQRWKEGCWGAGSALEGSLVSTHIQMWDFPVSRFAHHSTSIKFTMWTGGHKK